MARQLGDWLEHYMFYTQRSEPPELYHLWSGLTAISSALQRKCYCNWGRLRGLVYPNIFVALVGPPGGRKGTAMRIAKSMVQQLPVSMGADSMGSTQALYSELMDSENSYVDSNGVTKKHKSISIWADEFQVFLSDRDMALIPTLTDLFDCADVWKYKTKTKETDISNCWITIIGGITPALLQANLSQHAVGGGLISRIIFVVGYGEKQRTALQFLTEEEEVIGDGLINDLQEIGNLSGQFVMDNSFFKVYVRWYENTSNADGVPNERFLGYNSRRALHLNKICMLVSASESNDMVITDKHFEKALSILQATEKEMSNAFYGLGMAQQSNVYAKILSFIESRDAFDQAELVRNFHLDVNNMNELKGYMEMAEKAGLVSLESSMTTTRYNVVRSVENEVCPMSSLDKTVFRLMDRNKIKLIGEE